MIAKIKKGVASGSIKAPASKSMGHRLLICAALNGGKTIINNLPTNEDIQATIDCLREFGVEIDDKDKNKTLIKGKAAWRGEGSEGSGQIRTLSCRESGSTLRFLIPLALLDGVETRFTGTKRLFERPLTPYEDICKKQGISWEKEDDSLTIKGKLKPGEYSLAGNISSQFITGLLFALSKLEGESEIKLMTEVESDSYIKMTLDCLKGFSVKVERSSQRVFQIKDGANTNLKGTKEYTVEGDYSGASFFEALNYLDQYEKEVQGGDNKEKMTLETRIKIEGLKENTSQADEVWKEYFPMLEEGCPKISIKDCPDLGPILMSLAAALNGCTLTDTARLAIKESDRGRAMAMELAKCGVDVVVKENEIMVPGGKLESPRKDLLGHNDHRIVMALAVLLTKVGGEIKGAEAVSKSMPEFWKLLESLRIEVQLI